MMKKIKTKKLKISKRESANFLEEKIKKNRIKKRNKLFMKNKKWK